MLTHRWYPMDVAVTLPGSPMVTSEFGLTLPGGRRPHRDDTGRPGHDDLPAPRHAADRPAAAGGSPEMRRLHSR